jgi:hypothetical protein
VGLLLIGCCVWNSHESSDGVECEPFCPFERSDVLACDSDLLSIRFRLDEIEIGHQGQKPFLVARVEGVDRQRLDRDDGDRTTVFSGCVYAVVSILLRGRASPSDEVESSGSGDFSEGCSAPFA